jgi:hypothetical protein
MEGAGGGPRRERAFLAERLTGPESARAGFGPDQVGPLLADLARTRLEQLAAYRRRLERAVPDAAGLAPQPPPGPNWVPIGPLVARRGQAATQPLVSGRVPSLAVSRDGRRVYVASANGGVWASTDAGRSWRSRSDEFDVDPTHQQVDSLACGAIALVEGGTADQDRLYVGTGEGFAVFQGSFPSTGAYLGVGPIFSPDGGSTWLREATATPLLGHAFFALAVDPGAADHVVGATTDGLYRRTVSGGTATWTRQALPGGIPTASEVSSVVARRDGATTTFYAAVTGRGVVTSTTTGGATSPWTALEQATFPAAGVGRMSLAVSASSPRVLYALVARFVAGGAPGGGDDTSLHGVYRLDLADAAPRWRQVDGVDPALFGPADGTQGSYDQAIAVDPADGDRFVVGGSIKLHSGEWSGAVERCEVRTSGSGAARTFAVTDASIGASVHGDVHWLAYRGSDELWLGCDGGVFVSTDPRGSGRLFDARNTGLVTMTLNGLDHHPVHEAYVFCGGQDSGGLRYDGGGVWFHQLPGDGGATVVDWSSGTRFLNIYVRGTIRRAATDGARYASASADVPVSTAAGDATLFYPPLAGVPPDGVAAHARRVAFGSRAVWVSDDFGSTWATIPSGGGFPVDGVPGGSLVRSLLFVSHTRLFAGTRDGRLLEYTQGVGGWAAPVDHGRANGVRPVTGIARDRTDASGRSVFLTLGGSSTPDRVWHWDGSAFANRSTGLLDSQHNAICSDPANPSHLYAAADIGVWHSADSGAGWQPFSFGLPDAAVLDLDLHPAARLLRATTFGRGVFEVPVPPGALPQPGVELLVRTNQLEAGRRPAPVGVPNPIALAQVLGTDTSPDIRTDAPDRKAAYRLPPDHPADIAQFVEVLPEDGELLANEPAVPAVTRVYVQVHNLGVTEATGVRVTLLVGTPAAGARPALPAGFDAAVRAGDPIESPVWRTAGIRSVDGVVAGRPAIVGFDVSSAVLPPAAEAAGSQRVLLALVSHDDDPFTTATTAVDALVTAERKAGMRTVAVAAARGAAAAGAATGGADQVTAEAEPSGVSLLPPAAVAVLAHTRLGDAVDGLERKVHGGRVRAVRGGFPGHVTPSAVERQVLALATAARDVLAGGPATAGAPPVRPAGGGAGPAPSAPPVAGIGAYALLGAMGFEVPGYAGLLRPGGGWVADALRRGTSDPHRSHVAVPSAELALRAGQLGLVAAATDADRARVRAFAAGLLSAVAAGVVVAPQLRDLLARETNQDWERWRASAGARGVDELVRRRLFGGASGDRLASAFPPAAEVPNAVWTGLLGAIEEVYRLPAGRVPGFAEHEERIEVGSWLTAQRLAKAYEVFRDDLGTSSWHWAAWWGLLAPIVLGPSVTMLAARALPHASAFSTAGRPVDEHAVFELLQLGTGVGSVTPFVYSMILWGAVDEHGEAFVNALVLFVARAALSIGGLAASDDLGPAARWAGLFLPLVGTDVYAAIRASIGATAGRPGVATVFGLNTVPALTGAASLAFDGLNKLIVDASGSDDLWWLGWALETAGLLFGVGIPAAVALSRGGGIWSWFLRRDPRFPLLDAVASEGVTGREPVAFGRTFDDSTLWPDAAAGGAALGGAAPDLHRLAFPSGMRTLLHVRSAGGDVEVAADGHVVRLRSPGGAEQLVAVAPEGATARDLVARLQGGPGGVSAALRGAADPVYRLPWPATFADPGDAGPALDHAAARSRFTRAGDDDRSAFLLRHAPRADTTTRVGLADDAGGEPFPVVPDARLGDVEASGLGTAADLAGLLLMAAAPLLAGGTVAVADGVSPDLAPAQRDLGEVSEVFRRWNLDERRLNEWRLLVAGGAASEKRGAPATADPLMRPRAGPNPAPGGEPFATAMGWVPLWRAWLRVATDPAADSSAPVALPSTPLVTLADGTRRRLTNAELTLGVRFLLELE